MEIRVSYVDRTTEKQINFLKLKEVLKLDLSPLSQNKVISKSSKRYAESNAINFPLVSGTNASEDRDTIQSLSKS